MITFKSFNQMTDVAVKRNTKHCSGKINKIIIIILSIIIPLIISISDIEKEFTNIASHEYLWSLYDFLINYAGGFIRRGFTGELIYITAYITNISPFYITATLQIFLIAVFFYNLFRLIYTQSDIFRHIIAIYLPVTVSFGINFPVLVNKEIIYYALLSHVLRKKVENKLSTKFLYTYFALLFPALILSHEVFFALLPFSFILLDNNIKKIPIMSLPSVIAFSSVILSHFIHAKQYLTWQVHQIIQSYNKFGIQISDAGALYWLHKSSSFGFHTTEYAYIYLYHMSWLIHIVLYIINIAILIFLYRERISKKIISYFALSLGLMIPVFVVALDWDRFASMEAISLLIVLLSEKPYLTNNTAELLDNILCNKINNPIMSLIFIVVTSGMVGMSNNCTYPHDILGYLSKPIYAMLSSPNDKINKKYKHRIYVLNYGCKVIDCPANYPDILRSVLVKQTKEIIINTADLKHKFTKQELEVSLLAYCFITPNPFISYIEYDKACYKQTMSLLQTIFHNQKSKDAK
ncbi:MAG TPA: hypothetical protein ENO30_05955 [Thermodesulfobium narugense]|nr:hypothetical protein [Thermodesulfobium narugense]